MADSFVIGIDGGTEGLRAGIFDAQGRPIAFATEAYKTSFPKPGWAEQNPQDWWRALGLAVRKALAEAALPPAAIAGIALDTTCCSVVALDDRGQPLRPALIWMDVRAGAEAAEIAGCGDPALKINGAGAGPVSAEWMLPKALWLSQNEPDRFQAAATICEFQDYLNFHLTGRRVASIANAAVRWHYDARAGGYQPTLLERVGLSALLEKLPAEVLPLGAVIGPLTPEAAEHLGLAAGTPVAQGGSDAFVGMIGLGVIDAGRMALITGSSHLQLGLSAEAFHGPGIWGTYPDAVIPGLHVVEGGQTSTGSIINWFRQMLGDAGDYAALNQAAAGLPPGSDGLVVLDHFQGNRTPHTDPRARGVISGLTLSHGRPHLFRAIMEGVAFGTRLIMETMADNGYRPSELTVCGGATRSELWLQIHADVAGLPLRLTKVADAPALGSAILAAVGAGLHDGIPTAVQAMVHVERTIMPDKARHAAYRPYYDAYCQTYLALRDTIHAQVDAASG